MKLSEVLLKGVDLETNGLSTTISARRFSGKTYLLKELLNDSLIGKTFDEVYVFSDTGNLDCTWKEVKNKKVYIFDEYNPNDLENMLLSFREENEDNPKKTKVLIIIDDLMECFSMKKNNALSKLAAKGRHFGISFIYTSQRYIRFPPDIRTNTTSKIFFKISNGKESKAIQDELGNKKFDLEELIDEVTKKPYHYLLLKDGETNHFYSGYGTDVSELEYTD